MDLGINGKTALVCASSKGLGKACAVSLAKEGVHVYINGRTLETLEKTENEIQEMGGTVSTIHADVSTKEGRIKLLEQCPNPDILINNNGGPNPIPFAASQDNDWANAIEANMMAPILLMQAILPGMCERKFGRIINITSAMVKSPAPIMCIPSAVRAGLTALSKAVSRDVAEHNVTINNMLPEMFDTGRQEENAQLLSKHRGMKYEEARQFLVSRVVAGRFGQAHEFGDACAYLCSQQASYISGQNLQLDGGSYAGLI